MGMSSCAGYLGGCRATPSRHRLRLQLRCRRGLRGRVMDGLEAPRAEAGRLGSGLQDLVSLGPELRLRLAGSINSVSPIDWDACAGGNPFVRHGFLSSLEDSGSACPRTGWGASHLLAYDGADKLVGAVPLYLKNHSMGEYVFDQPWANAYARAGGRYYPKLQSCSPFSPVTGPRILVRPGAAGAEDAGSVASGLAKGIALLTEALGVSSAHVTFHTAREAEVLRAQGFLPRLGVQYHFSNAPGYVDFDAFLSALKQPKRKNIRQERKAVAAAGLTVARLVGDDITPGDWDRFYAFYCDTAARKWGQAYLTREFFDLLGERLKGDVMLVVAREGTEKVPFAAALNLIGPEAIYGRNWGCADEGKYKHLHFELCYYQV